MIILLLSLTFSTSDSWSPSKDKIGHFSTGYLVSNVSYMLYVLTDDNNHAKKIASSLASGICAAYLIEMYDLKNGREASLPDALYTFLGTLVGTWLINFIFTQGGP